MAGRKYISLSACRFHACVKNRVYSCRGIGRMFSDFWTLVVGVPVIAALLVVTVRRVRRLRRHIAEVRAEIARSPLPPFAQLSELLEEQKNQERTRGKRPH